MRVGVVFKFFDLAGVTKVGTRLAEHLTFAGHDVELVFIRGVPDALPLTAHARTILSGRSEKVSISLGLPVLRLFLHGQFSDTSSPDLLSWVTAGFVDRWKWRYDCIIYADELLAAFNGLFLDTTRVPYCTVVHETRSQRGWIEYLRKRVMNEARGVLSPSPIVTESLSRSLGDRAVLVRLCKPVADPNFARERFCLVDTRWSLFRDPFMLLDLMDAVPDVRFVMAGSFPSVRLEREFRVQAQSRLMGGRLEIRLNPSKDKLDTLYRTAGVFVRWPETREGIVTEHGITWGAVQALESGCPIVVDRRSAAASWIRGTGAGTEVGPDLESYASAIRDLLLDTERAATARRAAWNFAKINSIYVRNPQLEIVLSTIGR
jgi:glycosyltransferase involved in cell wall biosynthesis